MNSMETPYQEHREQFSPKRRARKRTGFGRMFLAGALGGLAVLLLASGLIYANRGTFFDYLASAYIEGDFGSRGFFSEESAITNIVEKVNPAVVSIVITKDVPVYESFLERGPFGFLIPVERQLGTEEREIGGGSGFLVSRDGLIVTNKHVIADPDATYTVFTQNGERYEVELVDVDPFFDLAILRINGDRNFPFLEFGDSSDLRLGQTVIAIGNALGEFRNSVSVGVVSGLSRSVVASTSAGDSELLDEVIQTDAAINRGNSGGPLLNTKGEVIGINVATAIGSENIGFALPAELASEAVASVLESGRISRPYLGVRFVELSAPAEELADLSVSNAALLAPSEFGSAIIPNSPADRAGLRAGDLIIEVNGQNLEENSLSSIIRKRKVGDKLEIVFVRNGRIMTVEATLEEVPQLVN
jgi:serine protease Do